MTNLALLELSSDELLGTLGRAHILIVHFPIALLIVAGLAELVHLLRLRSGRSPTAFACLGIGALSAIVASILGWLHADLEPVGSSVEELLFRHRWLGVAGAALATISFLLTAIGPTKKGMRRLYRGLLALTVVLIAVGAHYGGSMVYGSGYLFGYEPPRELKITIPTLPGGSPRTTLTPEVEAVSAESEPVVSKVDFHTEVRPIFESFCIDCHGSRKQKGDLRLDDLAEQLALPSELGVIQPGDAAGSILYQRVSLPEEHEDVMPAKGELLSEEQIATLRDWIDEGAEWSPELEK